MQQQPQMIPVMSSFPPTNITTEQIQKVLFFLKKIPLIYFFILQVACNESWIGIFNLEDI